ncbi:ribonuclease P 40kDa subunit [Stachybotrys elegans]|uniref:Ribonuclease P 40kDa subunit n=1 Tax=Stachybotrys elegans TaxID=80388 RepID=A0A8K0SJX7_9HYPO|nr:ribonuclease P 40kDa subunit [Stachybotrys elegans]
MATLHENSLYQTQKCFITYGKMNHVEAGQVTRRGKPWTSIAARGFIHKLDLIVPYNCLEPLRQKLVHEQQSHSYFRVTMTLGDILSGEFFTEYIKRGNILMLSRGKHSVDNVFMLHEGTLTMYIDRETYERAGLTGNPYGAKGARGAKPRWVISYDLRSPSMLHGKKGFDRLIYACKNVFNEPLSWLFCNVTKSTPSPDPLSAHSPARFALEPQITESIQAKSTPLTIPKQVLESSDRPGLEEFATDLYEWLSLVRLQSPRVEAQDAIDPYLSRYEIPGGVAAAKTETMPLCKLSWQGLIASGWVRDMLIDVLVTCPSSMWFALCATSFPWTPSGGSNELSLLRPPASDGEYLMWEISGSE